MISSLDFYLVYRENRVHTVMLDHQRARKKKCVGITLEITVLKEMSVRIYMVRMLVVFAVVLLCCCFAFTCIYLHMFFTCRNISLQIFSLTKFLYPWGQLSVLTCSIE